MVSLPIHSCPVLPVDLSVAQRRERSLSAVVVELEMVATRSNRRNVVAAAAHHLERDRAPYPTHHHAVVTAPHLEPYLAGLLRVEDALEVELRLVPLADGELEVPGIGAHNLRDLRGVGGADLDFVREKGVVLERLAHEAVPPVLQRACQLPTVHCRHFRRHVGRGVIDHRVGQVALERGGDGVPRPGGPAPPGNGGPPRGRAS